MSRAKFGRVPDAIRPGVDAHLDLLFAWSRAVGLTAFQDREEALAKGVLPSLKGLPFLPSGSFRALDVGSGGGFPAVPLALARRDGRWTLAEPSGRKAAFLRELSRVLDLPMEVREETAEALLRGGAGPFGVVTARGVRMDRKRVRTLAAGLAPGGSLLLWTGAEPAEAYEALLREAGLESSASPPEPEGTVLLRGIRA